MKYLILFISFLSFSTLALSQNNQGEIIYEEKVNIWKNLPPEMEGMKESIPEFRTSKSSLLFTGEETFYSPKERTKEEKEKARERRAGEGRRGRGRRGGRNRGSKEKSYFNLADNTVKSSSDFFGKQFLITGPPKTYKWKITGKQKQVGEFLCQEATYQDSTETIKAWFTPMIPVAAGPNKYCGLPGMILHMDFNDGSRMITAIDVQLKEIDATLIVEPTEGKKVSREEFEKIREEKMEEMKQEYGGEGRRVFMRRG